VEGLGTGVAGEWAMGGGGRGRDGLLVVRGMAGERAQREGCVRSVPQVSVSERGDWGVRGGGGVCEWREDHAECMARMTSCQQCLIEL
jgi:hypothetical protein